MQHLPDSHMVDHKKGVSTNFETLKSCIEPGLVGSMHDTGCLGLVHWDDPERWYGEGMGRGRVQDGEHMYTCGRFMLMYGKTQYCKVINLQLK